MKRNCQEKLADFIYPFWGEMGHVPIPSCSWPASWLSGWVKIEKVCFREDDRIFRGCNRRFSIFCLGYKNFQLPWVQLLSIRLRVFFRVRKFLWLGNF